MTSKFGSKDMLFWKRGSFLISEEYENLCIASSLIWFDGTRPRERAPWTPSKITLPTAEWDEPSTQDTPWKTWLPVPPVSWSRMEKTKPIFPNIVYKCLFTFKGGYNTDMNNLYWYRSWFIDANLRSILLYVYFWSWLRCCDYIAHLKM